MIKDHFSISQNRVRIRRIERKNIRKFRRIRTQKKRKTEFLFWLILGLLGLTKEKKRITVRFFLYMSKKSCTFAAAKVCA